MSENEKKKKKETKMHVNKTVVVTAVKENVVGLSEERTDCSHELVSI